MIVTWEADDIWPGRRVRRDALTEEWLIGYSPGEASQRRYAIISLSDGMICRSHMTKGELATFLTEARDLPSEALYPERIQSRPFCGAKAIESMPQTEAGAG